MSTFFSRKKANLCSSAASSNFDDRSVFPEYCSGGSDREAAAAAKSAAKKLSKGEASEPEEVGPAPSRKLIQWATAQIRGRGQGRRGSGCSDMPPDTPHGQDSRGNMLFALVQAGENVVLDDIAVDFCSQNAGAGLICMESKEQAAQLKALLTNKSLDASECEYKVVNGPSPKLGSVEPLHRGCGEEWPALFCGRASDTEEMTVCGRFKTPCGETLYIVEIKFRKEVAGSFRLTMAVLHRNMTEEVSREPEVPWTELAAICGRCSVRIIGGHLPRGKHQLITELAKVMPTTTILANREHPHPYCVLGGIRTTVATSSRVPFCVNQVETPDT